ncbi:MAG TPA: regulatory protein RecX, partial [Nakamurella sp.]|nr:regulatory protein RecX [Nakamurella sp.]
MAAPTIAGGHELGEPTDDRDEHDRHVPQPPADRAELIDELAARLAAIESRPRRSALPRPRAGAEPTGWRAGESGRRRGAEPGGHPEDAPGDPEAVAKAICLRLLTGAARPRAALETALRRRGIPDDVADRVLTRFVEVGLIDDKAYAEAFVAAKHRERALG